MKNLPMLLAAVAMPFLGPRCHPVMKLLSSCGIEDCGSRVAEEERSNGQPVGWCPRGALLVTTIRQEARQTMNWITK